MFFRYNEPKYYGFGLRLGVANLVRNGLSMGLKRTAGLVIHPIHAPSRFPEYYYLEGSMEGAIAAADPSRETRILDVGSPKCFGLYLAYHFPAQVHLTDIDGPAVQEAECLWNGVKHKAKGSVRLARQDARSLGYPDNTFDVVFSMSVVEHIQGSEGDTRAVREMVRVLRPGGVLALSVPFGQRYLEQEIVGLRAAAQKTGDRVRYFFQRIYSCQTLEDRILGAVSGVRLQSAVSIGRRFWSLQSLQASLGPFRPFSGFLFPLVSTLTNSSKKGIIPPPGRYGVTFTGRDTYGDVVLVWQKASGPRAETGDWKDGHA